MPGHASLICLPWRKTAAKKASIQRTFLIDAIARLPDHPKKRIAELLPRQWKLARDAEKPATVK